MRVLVCRAQADGEATARRLAEAGHEAVLAPVLTFVPIEAALPGPDGFQALLMTSAHAAEAMRESDLQAWGGRPLYAVGTVTASSARARGFRDVRVSAGSDGAALADLVRLTLPPPARLAYAAGRPRKPGLETALAERGYQVSAVEVYEAAEAQAWDEAVLRRIGAGQIEACLHYSRRSAALALAFAERGGILAGFAPLRHFCISDDAAQPLRAAGLDRITIAPRTGESALLSALSAECGAPT